ncbi:MAG: immunoglobulin domain-containing protein [Verrucomicrobiota bacterium]
MKKPHHIVTAALGLGLLVSSPALAGLIPVSITPGSYNADVVVENTATPQLRIATTATIDQGTNNQASTLFEIGFDTANPANGLPLAGSTFTALDDATHSFKMPPSYTAPNGILINTVATNGTFTLTTPAAYTKLSFLGLGGNGGDVIGVIVNHQDGTFEDVSFGCPDWFGGSGVAYIMGGRIGQNLNLDTQVNGNSGDGRANPRVYFRDVTLTNTTSAVTNLVLRYVSGSSSSHNAILGVSGATTVGGNVGPITVTGFTHDFVVEASAAKRARVISQTIVDGTNVWATSQSMDNTGNTANSWYEKGYNYNIIRSGPTHASDAYVLALAASTGLPNAGASITNTSGDRIYQFPPSYTANNAIYLSTVITNANIGFASPVTASVLSFLASAGNGPALPVAIISHQNGTTETNAITVPDWFNTATPMMYGANGRVAVDTAQINNTTNTTFTPRLFGCDIVVSPLSPVTNVALVYTNTGGRLAILAVSSANDPIAPVFVSQPNPVKVNVGSPASFTASAIANVTITYQWQKGTNGVYVNVVDGGTFSGAQTTTLSISAAAEVDEADYRMAATTVAGTTYSAAASLTVITALAVMTSPSDAITAYQPLGGSSPGGEAVSHAIDQNTSKYLNFGTGGNINSGNIPLGFVVTPSVGRTRLNAMILYTANDATERDPGNVVLEGSDNGGSSWSLIYSNLVTVTDNRNNGGLTTDPLTQNILQIRFANNNAYSMYRWYLTRTKASANLMQIGEVELRGVVDTSGLPNFTTPPASLAVFNGASAAFSANANGTPTPGYFWLKKNGSSYSAVINGGAISGAASSSLSINPVGFANAGDYVCVATNNSGSVTSSVATLTVVSTYTDVTSPSDTITGFGDTTGTRYGASADPALTFDNFNTIAHINGGSGLNATAGFPPFGGPVGVVVTPAAGLTKIFGVRFYTSTEAISRDPADYVLEGSNNGGTSYTVISQGALSLPFGRADNNLTFDPTLQPMQEILFNNNAAYTSYRVTFNNIRNNNTDSALAIGEVELLGSAVPTVSIAPGAGGSLDITTSIAGTLQSSTNLTTGNWTSEGPISGTLNIVPNPSVPAKFYRVVVP